MRGSSERSPINIAASTPKVQVDNRFPISKYYRTADNILKQVGKKSLPIHTHTQEKKKNPNLILLNLNPSFVALTLHV
mgnify:CR=1 FL=1